LAVFLVVGLGNPGPKYRDHRHNVGFMVVDRVASAHARDPFREKFQGSFTRGTLEGNDFVLLKPQTFMNLSGESVQKAMTFFKVELAHLIVVHDELDLPFGTLRVKQGGGLAGHNGLKSIQQCCGGPDFVRLRVGIGKSRSSAGATHVLSDFSREECHELPDVVERAALAIGDIMVRGVSAAMNAHNQQTDRAPKSKG
jgi:PTH1 family peptidyl-tRNA hydrolase